MIFKTSLAAALVGLMPLTALAQDLDEARIRELVLETIRQNPEIVMEAVAILDQRQAAEQAAAKTEVLTSQRDMLERDPNAPVLGNPEGDVTIVEFFDYNCPYCRRATPEVTALMEQDPNVRLVYREWPILGEASVFATKAALASREQGQYEAFHEALMALQGRAEEANVMKIAADLGMDIDKLRADMDAPQVQQHIDTSMSLAQSLGFNGTPSFVIGENMLPGFVEQATLADLVAQTRAATE